MTETEAPASVRCTRHFHKTFFPVSSRHFVDIQQHNHTDARAPNFNGKPPEIGPSSLILVTSINSFIGSHIADQLLQAGCRVRGTTRDTSKTEWVKEMLDKQYGEGKFEAVIVKNMADTGSFDEACKDMLSRNVKVIEHH